MRVFVTGASGFIGRATVQELLNNGHQVLGLARNDAAANTITKLGAEPHRGDLEDLDSLKNGARASDGVIHLAFIHDFSQMAKSTAVDRAAIAAFAEVLSGTGKPLLVSSGTLGLPKGDSIASEDTSPMRENSFSDRVLSEDSVVALAKEKGFRGQVIRFTPTVHGKEDAGGFIPRLIGMARKNGRATYVGDGLARWPAVHRIDAAALLRLALEKGRTGAVYHAIDEEGVQVKDTMEVIGKCLQLPVESKSQEDAFQDISFFAFLQTLDNPTSSEKTREELGWKPTQLGLLADIEANYFF